MSEDDVARALDTWAADEGFASRQELLEATFAVPSVTHVWARLARGERLEILADPFVRWGMRMTETADPALDKNMQDTWDSVDDLDELAPTSAVPSSRVPSSRVPSSRVPSSLRTSRPPGGPDPMATFYPILAVVAADGEVHPEERRMLDDLVRREGLPPLADDVIAVYPAAPTARLVPRARREATLKIMCEIAAADGMVDESERRVIHAYATAWGVADETVDFWIWGYENMNASLVRQLWTRLRRFVLPTRWAETKKPLFPSNRPLSPNVPESR